MGFWPFGGGKRQRAVESDDHGREALVRRAPPDTSVQQEKYGGDAAKVGRSDSKMQREETKGRRLSKTRTPSSKALSYAQPSRSQTAPTHSTDNIKRTSRTDSQYDEKGMYQQTPLSQTSLGPENFTVVQAPPTLHAKRSEYDPHLPRRKSSKRKAEDFAREREIRAMTSSPIPIPKRPATLYGTGPLERDSRQIPGPLNRRLERPTSEISLPLPGSLPNVTDFPSQHSFKIGILAALSPRPTIRYDANPKSMSGKLPARSGTAIRQAIVEEDVSDKKRIDELADDLDAGGLRELLERDRRRRERKKETEKAKLQRRLQRRAERQREEEARRARTEAFVRSSPAPTPRPADSSIESSPYDQKDSPYHRQADELDESDPFVDPGPSTHAPSDGIRNPFEDEKDMDIMNYPNDSEVEVEVGASAAIPVPKRSPHRPVIPQQSRPRQKLSQSTLSPPTSPVNRAVDRSSLSQASFMNREPTPDIPESASLDRRASDQSSQRLSSWTTFFKRGTRRKFTGPSQGRTTPSEFSNTSRESISRKQPPTVAPRTFRRSDSATPQRTMSRFREDLPELPISPPDSRMQSPEAGAQLGPTLLNPDTEKETPLPQNNNLSARDGSKQLTSTQLQRRSLQQSGDLDVPMLASTEMMLSQSLASVDSEGSWLSGKPSKRHSSQVLHGPKPSHSSLKRPIPGAFGVSDDIDSSSDTDDENVPGLISERVPNFKGQQAMAETAAGNTAEVERQDRKRAEDSSLTSQALPTSTAASEKRQQTVARHPTLVRQAGRAKSQEGLLEQFGSSAQEEAATSSGEAEDTQDSDVPYAEASSTPLLRARSVEYKGHVRHISAGSAKLLDIRRSSIHSDSSRPTTAFRKSDLSLHLENPAKLPEIQQSKPST